MQSGPFTLTPAQTMRLGCLGAECKVVGAAEDCPLVQTGKGRVMRIEHDGRVMRASSLQRKLLMHKAIDIVHPVV